MPWEHCGQELHDDTLECPECGTTKEKWTLEFQVTRTFSLRRRRPLRIELVDPDGEPVPGEPYWVELPDGEVVEGELDEEGKAELAGDQVGDVRIAFPYRHPDELHRLLGAADGEDDDDQPGEEPPPADGGPPDDGSAEREGDAAPADGDAGRIAIVQRGDRPQKLARQYGFASWEEVMAHPRNATLREQRDPGVVHLGDEVFIPQRRPPEQEEDDVDPGPQPDGDEDEAREQASDELEEGWAAQWVLPHGRRYRFELGDPECAHGPADADRSLGGPLTIRLVDADGEPAAGEWYTVKWADGTVIEGELDDEGRATVPGKGLGEATVSFPDREAHEVLALTPETHCARYDIDEDEQQHG